VLDKKPSYESKLPAVDAEAAKIKRPARKDDSRAVEVAMNSIAGNAAGKAADEIDSMIADAWPAPTPLPDALPAVAAFDDSLMPLALRPWVADVAHRMQCPADFVAVAVIVVLSSLVGARVQVRPKAKDDWLVVPNLWGLVVGRPGVKKSPALNEVLRQLSQMQAIALELWEGDHDAWTIDCKVAAMTGLENERKAKAIVGKNKAEERRQLLIPPAKPPEPVARRYLVNDATVERLGVLLKENPWGTLSYRDELYGLLTSLDKQGQEGSRAFYLQAYDGNQSYVFDRIGRGTTSIPRVCLAMLGGIQPGRVQEYVRGAVSGGTADDGLLQRFSLSVWPDPGPYEHVDQSPDYPARDAAFFVMTRLANLKPKSEKEPAVWRFDAAAQALFVEWLIPFENEIRGDDLHPAMVSHLAKFRKLIPALALLFALIDTPDSEGNKIGEAELLRALAWGDYLRTHANRLYAAATIPETAGAEILLDKIKAGKLTLDGAVMHSFTCRLVAIKHWTGLATPDSVRKAAELLVDFGWLARDSVSSTAMGGRPTERFLIHPMLLDGLEVKTK
jgi:putative DNA primase/helicase